jgi:hypothetical protein
MDSLPEVQIRRSLLGARITAAASKLSETAYNLKPGPLRSSITRQTAKTANSKIVQVSGMLTRLDYRRTNRIRIRSSRNTDSSPRTIDMIERLLDDRHCDRRSREHSRKRAVADSRTGEVAAIQQVT